VDEEKPRDEGEFGKEMAHAWVEGKFHAFMEDVSIPHKLYPKFKAKS
jgi:hypothetical protein